MRTIAFLLVMAGCFSPEVTTGSPCEINTDCPSSQVCSSATQTCERAGSPATPDAPIAIDGEVDAAPVAPVCYGTGLLSICMPPPAGVVQLAPAIDTSACANVIGEVCVIAAEDIIVPTDVVVTGARPLVLIGASSIIVDGTIDAASRRGGKLGPGASTAPCAPVTSQFSAGGSGGTFGGRGGEGGDGPDGNGQLAPSPTIPLKIRAGCPGATGGQPKPGAGGAGGGALYLISAGTITIRGKLDVSGAGGSGGLPGDRGTGGGGGSGGFIGIDAPSRSITGALIANGGGGGEGGGSTSAGNPGGDGNATGSAQGGENSSTNGGNGGDGSFAPNGAGENGSDADSDSSGGGGGGGGAGVIRVF